MMPRVNSLAAHGVNVFGKHLLLMDQSILARAAKATLIKCSIS
jgi:hypothetical protein